jgi:peptide deformylase
MAVLPILIWPDPGLAETAQPVTVFNDALRTHVHNLFETMYHAKGIGLASTQVGVAQQILVIDLDPHKESQKDPTFAEELKTWGFKEPVVVINPKVVSQEGSIVWEEGCLSVPGFTDDVTRSEHIVVEACTLEGKPFTLDAHGLFAVALQHEMDHLKGKVFVEYVSKLKRDMVRKKLIRLKAEHPSENV